MYVICAAAGVCVHAFPQEDVPSGPGVGFAEGEKLVVRYLAPIHGPVVRSSLSELLLQYGCVRAAAVVVLAGHAYAHTACSWQFRRCLLLCCPCSARDHQRAS